MSTPGRKHALRDGFLPDLPSQDICPEAAMNIQLPNPCPFCIDGYQPGGLHDDLGPVFLACLVCQELCPACEGDGLFPADETCAFCFTNLLARRGLNLWRCGLCFGVVDLIPTDQPEVYPHVH